MQELAWAMERQLMKNDHKNGGGWDGIEEVFCKLIEEVHELMKEACGPLTPNHENKLLMEAADVANLAGMVVVYCCNMIPSYEKIADE